MTRQKTAKNPFAKLTAALDGAYIGWLPPVTAFTPTGNPTTVYLKLVIEDSFVFLPKPVQKLVGKFKHSRCLGGMEVYAEVPVAEYRAVLDIFYNK